jgi:hypothetical protein
MGSIFTKTDSNEYNKSKYYITIDDVKHAYETNEEKNIQFEFMEILKKIVLSHSQQYNCLLEPINDGYLIFGYPKNEPVVYPRILNTVQYSR